MFLNFEVTFTSSKDMRKMAPQNEKWPHCAPRSAAGRKGVQAGRCHKDKY